MVDIQYQLKHLKDPSFTVPTDPLANASKTEMRVWEKEVDEYVIRKTRLRYMPSSGRSAHQL